MIFVQGFISGVALVVLVVCVVILIQVFGMLKTLMSLLATEIKKDESSL